ncbi:MAG: hypothetical protein MPJ50_11080 [Pirellulales bacterium]|nr:hypothetical protein [Pirellulales bacterium]
MKAIGSCKFPASMLEDYDNTLQNPFCILIPKDLFRALSKDIVQAASAAVDCLYFSYILYGELYFLDERYTAKSAYASEIVSSAKAAKFAELDAQRRDSNAGSHLLDALRSLPSH